MNNYNRAFSRLANDCRLGNDLDEAWRSFEQAAASISDQPPYHVQLLLDLLDEVRGERPRQDIRILDHGCGGAKSLIFLLSQGYEEIYGVDVGGWCEDWNRLLNNHLGFAAQRFFVYDGRWLPFSDDQFDFIFSNQVLEHVHPDMLDHFYSEERRTLAEDGVCYHQVPHRLVPFDSHTGTWFIHYLPRKFWLAILKRIRPMDDMPKGHLFLCWPWVHRRFAKRFLGPTEDRTLERFRGLSDFEGYDGPIVLRRILGHLVRLPIIGWIAGLALKNLVMIDTVSGRSVNGAKSEGQEVRAV